MPAALATFATSDQTVTHNATTNTFTIAGDGSTAAFHIDDEPNNVTGATLVFTSGAFPQLDFAGTLGDPTGLRRTTIIESSSAGQPGRTADYGATGRFRGTEAVTPLQLWNLDWKIDSSDGGETNSKESAFLIGGSPSSSDLNGRLIEFRGVSVEGAFADNVLRNQRARIINNPQRGFGLRLWMKLSSNTLPFTLVVACAPDTNPSGLVLLRGTTTPVASGLQYFANDLATGTTLTLSGLDASGVGIFPSGGNLNNTTVALVDPVGDIGKFGAPYSGGSLAWGRLRIFRTKRFSLAGADASGDTLTLTNTTASAPAWASPTSPTIASDNTASAVLAVKEIPHGSKNATNYNSYSYRAFDITYRRNQGTITMPATGDTVATTAITLVAAEMADRSAVTAFTADSTNKVEDLDEVFRAIRTYDVANPGARTLDIITTSDAEYLSTHSVVLDNTATTVGLSGTTLTIPAASTVETGDDAAGLSSLTGTITAANGTTLDFPRSDTSGTIRRIRVTGSVGWKGAVFASTGTSLSGILDFTNTNQVRSFYTAHEGGLKFATMRAGYIPGINASTISAGDALTIDYSIAGGDQPRYAETDALKYKASLDVAGNGTHIFDVDHTADPAVPSCKVNVPDKEVPAQACYSRNQSGLATLDGLEFLAFGGTPIDVEAFATSGIVLLLKSHSKLRRENARDNLATVAATVYHPEGQWLDDSNGSVSFAGGVSQADINRGVTNALLSADIFPESETVQTFGQVMKAMQTQQTADATALTNIAAAITALNNLSASDVTGAVPTAAQVVAAIKAADFGSAAGTQTLTSMIEGIKTAVDNGSVDTAAIVTAIQGADFQDGAGTGTLANRLAAILTAIAALPTDSEVQAIKTETASIRTTVEAIDPPTAAEVATAVAAPTASTIATAVENALTIPTPPSTSAIATAVQGALNNLGASDITAAVPTAAQIATAVNAPTASQVATAVEAALNDPSTADIVTAIKAADFASDSGTQTLEQVLASISTAIGALDTDEIPSASSIATATVTAIKAANFGSGVEGAPTQTLAQALAAIKTAVDNGTVDTASIVTAIQAADFGSAAGTQTLANRIAAILTAIDDLNDLSASQVTGAVPTASQVATAVNESLTIPTPPTANAIANAVAGVDLEEDTEGDQTIGGQLKAIKADTASIKTTAASLPNVEDIASVVPTPPSAANVANAVLAADISTARSGTQTLGALIAEIQSSLSDIDADSAEARRMATGNSSALTALSTAIIAVQNSINNLLLIPTPPTATVIAAAVGDTISPVVDAAVEEAVSRANSRQETPVDQIVAGVRAALPTAEETATATLSSVIASGRDLREAVRLTLAVVLGQMDLDQEGNRATFHDLDGNARVRLTFNPNTKGRTAQIIETQE